MSVKKPLIFIAVLLFGPRLNAQDIVRFRLSKPYCLFNFLNTCRGERGISEGLSVFIEKEGVLEDSGFQKIVAAYKAIPLDYSYSRAQYPERRMRSRYGNLSDLLVIAAVQSDDLGQFREKTVGLLPNSDHRALFRVLSAAMPYYERLVWDPGFKQLGAQLTILKSYESRISRLFSQLNAFYSGSWTADLPFVVTIYPVPGRRVGTSATPHINTLCVGVRSGEEDYDGIAGVVLHEMCHSLYNEQPVAVQQAIDRCFSTDTSRYTGFAYNYFDEGLATACGNGWARESFNGEADRREWYHDNYIDRYGHALYPLVKEYLAQGKTIDSAFIAESIKRFAILFPKAPYDYGLLLNSINLYSDAEDPAERASLQAALNKHFRISSYSSSTPVLDPESLRLLANTTTTQVVIVQKNRRANLARLREIFPQLASSLKGRADEDFVAAFYDDNNRPVIIITAATPKALDKGIASLSRQKYLDPSTPYFPLQ